MKKSFCISILIQMLVLIAAIGLWAGLCSATEPSPLPEIPVKGKITMVVFGQSGCVGCTLQARAIRSLEEKYRESDQVAIIYVDITTHTGQVTKYQLEEVPTQIFYDKDGNEVYRHKGIMLKGSIVSRLTKIGARQ